jgi:hypothetical protein
MQHCCRYDAMRRILVADEELKNKKMGGREGTGEGIERRAETVQETGGRERCGRWGRAL